MGNGFMILFIKGGFCGGIDGLGLIFEVMGVRN